MLGFPAQLQLISLNDTAELYATLTDTDTNTPVEAALVSSVQFSIQKPDKTIVPQAGTVQADGRAYLRFTDTDIQGHYMAIAQFTLTNGIVRSVRCDFQVQNPFEQILSLATPGGLLPSVQVGGGTFAAGTYYWRVTAFNTLGETGGSNQAVATVATSGSVVLNWSGVTGATGYNVYRAISANGLYLSPALVHSVSGGSTTTYTDTGTAATEGAVPSITTEEILAERVWLKIEDCFDSELGGPYLRDQTLAFFTKDKVVDFVEEGLMDINLYHPPTDLSLGDFITQRPDGTYTNLPLVVEATFLAVVRHLMRSYVEQPDVTGANVVYDNRRDYLDRWARIYEIEYQLFDHWTKLFKRGFLGLGQSKMLISNKAGRLVPSPMRSWSVGRGYW